MARPTDDPIVWGTDTNYPAGADSWNGTPVKVAPSAGVVAAGWEPEDRPPAQHLNHLLHNHGAWLDYLRALNDALPLDNWSGTEASGAEVGGCYTICGGLSNSREVWVRGSSTKTIYRSTNGGKHWTAASSMPAAWGAAAETRKIIYDGTYFVAVGRSGGNWIATSTDGDTWTDRSPAGAAGLYSVAWDGASAYVAVGSTGGIYLASSPTGTWTAQTPAAAYAGQFRSVFWDGSQFVAVGSAGAIQTSPDGATWAAQTAAAAYAGTFVGVSGNGSRLIAVGTSALAMQYSDDGGATWSDATSSLPSWITDPADILYSSTFGQWLVSDFTEDVIGRTLEPIAGDWHLINYPADGGAQTNILEPQGMCDTLGRVGVAVSVNAANRPTCLLSMRART
jgi:hypothetical protein